MSKPSSVRKTSVLDSALLPIGAALLLGALSLLATGCGESEDKNTRERKSSIVFTVDKGTPSESKLGRTVGQNRFHALRTNDLVDWKDRQREFRLSAASRATATLWTQYAHLIGEDGNCSAPSSAAASAVLVTDFHALTAAHFTRSLNIEHRSVGAAFDGLTELKSPTSSAFEDYRGFWAADSEKPNSPFWNSYPIDYEETMDHRFSAPQETPFLINRLFQMGLVEWARDDHLIWRQMLHRVLSGEAKNPWDSPGEGEIGFVVFNSDNWSNLVFFHNSISQDPFQKPASGRFSIRSPAPFYNTVSLPMGIPGEPPSDGEFGSGTEVFGLFASEFPGEPDQENGTEYFTTVVAREGYVDPQMNVTVPFTTCDEEGQRIEYDADAVLGSIDAIQGASGGGIFGCYRPDCSLWVYPGGTGEWKTYDDYYGHTTIKGIIAATYGDLRPPPGEWGPPGPFGDERATAVIPLSDAVVETLRDAPVIDKDTGEVFLDSLMDTAVDPADKPLRLECTGWSHSRTQCSSNAECPTERCGSEGTCLVCTDFNDGELEHNEYFGTPLTEFDFTVAGLDDPSPTGDGDGDAVEPVSAHTEGARRQLTNCSMLRPPGTHTVTDKVGNKVQPRAMIGIRGGLLTDQGWGNGHGVGTFRPVCGPWTGQEYTDNWRHLVTNGPWSGPDNWGKSMHNNRLADALLHEWEVVVNGADEKMSRPASMKLCPPNYLLHGFRMKTSENRVVGLTHLICLPVNSKAGDGELLVPLHAEEESGIDLVTKIGSHPLPVTQYIGDPLWPAPTEFNLTCKKRSEEDFERVVQKIATKHTDGGYLAKVWLGCMPPPQ